MRSPPEQHVRIKRPRAFLEQGQCFLFDHSHDIHITFLNVFSLLKLHLLLITSRRIQVPLFVNLSEPKSRAILFLPFVILDTYKVKGVSFKLDLSY